MKTYARSHFTLPALFQSAASHRAQTRTGMAELLAGMSRSMRERHTASAAIHPCLPGASASCICLMIASSRTSRPARVAREFPVIFAALADGRLHVLHRGVCLLAPHLNQSSAGELLAAPWARPRSKIERLLAQRFPRSEELAMIEQLPGGQHAPAHVEASGSREAEHAPALFEFAVGTSPIAPGSFGPFRSPGTVDKLQYAQELLSHQIAAVDVGAVLDRALDALIPRPSKAKIAATERPRPGRPRQEWHPIHPAEVKRAVWERMAACTLVGDAGHRSRHAPCCNTTTSIPSRAEGRRPSKGSSCAVMLTIQSEAERIFGASVS